MNHTAEQVQQMVQQALAEFERLTASEQPPTPVLQQMLGTMVRTLESVAGAVWLPTDNTFRNFKPIIQAGASANLITGGGAEGAGDPSAHAAVLQAASQNKPVAVSPDQGDFQGSPLGGFTQFFLPIEALGRIGGVIHLVHPPDLDPKAYRQYVSFAQQGARAAAVYLARRQSQVLKEDAASHAGVVKLMHKMLGLQNPSHLTHELANHARQMLEARRVAVVGLWRRRADVQFSNTIEANRRAVVVRCAELLAEQVRERGVPMSFTRGQELQEEDQPLAPLLDQLYEMGGAGAVCLAPMRSGEEVIGVLIAEFDDADAAARRSAVQQELAQQAGPVLEQAVRWHTRPLRRTSNVIAAVRRRPITHAVRTLLGLGVIAALVYVLFFIAMPMQIAADAQLVPAHLAAITSPHAGRIMRVNVETGQTVEPGDVLLELDDTDLQLQRTETLKAIDAERVAMEVHRRKDELAALRSSEYRIEQYEARLATVDRQIDRCQVRAMISGVVLDEKPQQLVGQSVADGKTLLQIADLQRFDLMMEVREEDLALIVDTIRDGGQVPVRFLSRPWPDLVQTAVIADLQALAPTSILSERERQHVFRISVPVKLEGLQPQLVLANPSGRAKLEVAPESLGYAYGRRVWRFIQMYVLF